MQCIQLVYSIIYIDLFVLKLAAFDIEIHGPFSVGSYWNSVVEFGLVTGTH